MASRIPARGVCAGVGGGGVGSTMTNSSPLRRASVSVSRSTRRQRAQISSSRLSRVCAEGVVDRLEAVEVEQQHRGAAAVAPMPAGRLWLRRSLSSRAVGQVGERVVVGEVQDARLASLRSVMSEDADGCNRLSVRPSPSPGTAVIDSHSDRSSRRGGSSTVRPATTAVGERGPCAGRSRRPAARLSSAGERPRPPPGCSR